jgi:hypothetical protein
MYNTDKFLNIPYMVGGASFEGCDCWGFVCLVERELFGVTLPLYLSSHDTPQSIEGFAHAIERYKPWFTRLSLPVDGAIALMKIKGKAIHTGVWIDNYILHCDPSCILGTSMFRCTDIKIASRIEGYYSAT